MVLRKRKLNRLPGWDYSSEGYYFITFCVRNRIEYFGNIDKNIMMLNKYGKVVDEKINQISNIFKNTRIDIYQIMPNHIHILIWIVGTGQCPVPTGGNNWRYGKISKIINGLKGISSKQIHELGLFEFQWQRSYYDRIIRNEKELIRIRQYIKNNPDNWHRDRNNLDR